MLHLERKTVRRLMAGLICASMIVTWFALQLPSKFSPHLTPESIARAVVLYVLSLISGFDVIADNADSLGLTSILSSCAPLAAVFSVAIFVSIRASSWANAIFRRFLSPTDTSLLRPIPATQALDPLRASIGAQNTSEPLRWRIPIEGVRLQVWTSLNGFLQSASVFEYQLLLGGPGAGKTRLAVEFARSISGEPAISEGGTLSPVQKCDTVARRVLSDLRSFLRLTILRRRPIPGDPWDVGWLSPEDFDKYDGERREIELMLAELSAWRPRRPTLILLDDPLPGDTFKAVSVFKEHSSDYRHPVRLVVVSQSAPGDLKLVRASDSGQGWSSTLLSAFSAPLLLPSYDQLSDADVRLLAGDALPDQIAKQIITDAGVFAFNTVTRGNPLLAELGFEWLRRGRLLSEMSENALLEARAERIRSSIETAGFSRAFQDVLAAATIASGAPLSIAYGSATADKTSIWQVFGMPRVETRELARLYPAEADIRRLIPPVRPDMIGEAFVRMALRDLSEAERANVISVAWRASPLGTLRTLLSLDAGYGGNDVEDPLRQAFDLVPIEAGLDRTELFRAFAEAAGTTLRSDWSHGRHRVGEALWERCQLIIADMTTPEMEDAFGFLVGLLESAVWEILPRHGVLSRLIAQIILRLETLGDLPATVIDLIIRWGSASRFSHLVFDRSIPRSSGTTVLPAELLRLFNKAQNFQDGSVRAFVVDLIARNTSAKAPGLGRVLFYVMHICRDAELFMVDGKRQQWKALVKKTLAAEQELKTEPDLLALALNRVVFAAAAREEFGLLADCSEMAARIDTLTELVSDLARLRGKRVTAWRSVVYLSKGDPQIRENLAKMIDEISAPFPSHPKIQTARAEAWRHVATTTEGSRRASLVHYIEEIAAPFPNYIPMQAERLDAWLGLADTERESRSRRHEIITHMLAVAAEFPNSAPLQQRVGAAWRSFAHASDDVESIREAISVVEKIGETCPLDEGVQEERLETWRALVNNSRQNALVAHRATLQVELIAAPFEKIEAIQSHRAAAWRMLTAAANQDAKAREQHALKVEGIAKRFPANENIQEWWIEACFIVATANGTTSSDCERMLRRVGHLGELWPMNVRIQDNLAALKLHLARFLRDRSKIQSIFHDVAEIASRHSENPTIQAQLADAWVVLSETSEDTDERLECAERVERILQKFPADENISMRCVQAWGLVLDEVGKDEERKNLGWHRIAKIGAAFPDNEDIQMVVAAHRGGHTPRTVEILIPVAGQSDFNK